MLKIYVGVRKKSYGIHVRQCSDQPAQNDQCLLLHKPPEGLWHLRGDNEKKKTCKGGARTDDFFGGIPLSPTIYGHIFKN